jgi:biotin carboxyl carrier protein
MKTYNLNINGHDYEVVVNCVEDNVAKVTVNGVEYDVVLNNKKPLAMNMAEGDKASVDSFVSEKALSDEVKKEESLSTANKSEATLGDTSKLEVVTSPLPGVVLEICVKEGDVVKEGQKLLVLEAMKMENAIMAEKDGVVRKIHVSQGESVLEEAALITIG